MTFLVLIWLWWYFWRIAIYGNIGCAGRGYGRKQQLDRPGYINVISASTPLCNMPATNLLDQQAAKTTPSPHRQLETEHTSSHIGTPPPNMPSKERSDADVEQQATLLKGTNIPKWKPDWTEIMIMVTLAILSLMVSLDATVIVTSLSVCTSPLLSRNECHLTWV
jgi:hypothetical protein